MKKKVLALVLTLAMLASLLTVPAAAAGGKTFPDAKGHWAEESIMRWSRTGLVKGDELGNVNPDKPLRRCEMATIISDMLGLRTAAPISTFIDIDGTEWYARAILRCAAAGIMEGNNSKSYPEDYITREEAIAMFCRALGVARDDDPDLSKFSDGGQVSGWAAPYLATLTELGILSGMGDGTIAPHANINRAGAFTLMDKAISVYANAPGNYTSKNGNGFVVINANTHQEGDVIVSGKAVSVLVPVGATDTIRLRDLTAESLTVNGKSDVIIGGKSSVGSVEVSTEIGLTVEANATVGTLEVDGEKAVLTNAGTVEKLICDEVSSVSNSGKVTELVMNTNATVTNTGTVDKLVANAGITVNNNKGTVKKAEINKGGVIMDGPPQEMTLADGVVRPSSSSGRPISATGTVSTPSGSSGGSSRPSGGSSSGSGSGSGSTTTAVTGVSITPEGPLTLKVDGTVQLTADVSPSGATNKNVEWSVTQDGEYILIDDATKNPITVTALEEGEATIKVTTKDGSKIAECTVTVEPKEGDDPDQPKIELNHPSLTLTLKDGETVTETLKVTVDGEETTEGVTWSSGDDAVATVVDGLVTAVGKGTTSITAIVTIDGKEYPLTCDVEVKPAQGNEEEHTVTLSQTALTLTLKDGETVTETLVVKVDGEPTTAAVKWSSGDDTVATVVDGLVTAVEKGTTSITAIVTIDGKEYPLTCEVEVKPAQGNEEESSVTSVNVTPDTASIEVGKTLQLSANVEVVGEISDSVRWESSNQSVATVDDNGLVTAIAASDEPVTITATAVEDNTQTGTCTITVTPKPVVTVTKVNINPEGDFELKIENGEGGEKVLTAIVKLSNNETDTTRTVTWSVTKEDDSEFDDDEAVVSVTPTETTGAGTVTVKALKAGAAKVVVTVTDGEETLTCTVTVTVSSANTEEGGGGNEGEDPNENPGGGEGGENQGGGEGGDEGGNTGNTGEGGEGGDDSAGVTGDE